jgi:hypothetical protein
MSSKLYPFAAEISLISEMKLADVHETNQLRIRNIGTDVHQGPEILV